MAPPWPFIWWVFIFDSLKSKHHNSLRILDYLIGLCNRLQQYLYNTYLLVNGWKRSIEDALLFIIVPLLGNIMDSVVSRAVLICGCESYEFSWRLCHCLLLLVLLLLVLVLFGIVVVIVVFTVVLYVVWH